MVTIMEKPNLIRIHLELPPEENDILDSLQRQYRDKLQVNFVSKASTIRYLIRNASIHATGEPSTAQSN